MGKSPITFDLDKIHFNILNILKNNNKKSYIGKYDFNLHLYIIIYKIKNNCILNILIYNNFDVYFLVFKIKII